MRFSVGQAYFRRLLLSYHFNYGRWPLDFRIWSHIPVPAHNPTTHVYALDRR